MHMLELKIPPLLLVLLFMVLMWLIARILPGFDWHVSARVMMMCLFVIAGAAIALAGVRSFARAKTTVDPTHPDSASTLVTSGVYRLSRNPMYVGFLFLLLGWGVWLANPFSIFAAYGFVLYMNRFQIRPEEKVLRNIFAEQFDQYSQQVRRWL